MIRDPLLPECQLHDLQHIAPPVGRWATVWQWPLRLKRITKRRLAYVRNWLWEGQRPHVSVNNQSNLPVAALQPGDQVRVRSADEIRATLDRWNRLKGCTFLAEMAPYCGTTQKVFKCVTQFLDERDYLIKRSRGLVLLEGVICHGTVDFGCCDRSCFFFWRAEWLEKIS